MAGKPIIVASDGSSHSLRVLPHAAVLAQTLGSELQLLRIVERSEVDEEPGEPETAALERTIARLRAETESALQWYGAKGTVRIEVPVGEEEPVDALLRLASDGELLAMHSRGRSAILRLLQGSVALGVLQNIAMPVMLGGPELLSPPVNAAPYRLMATTDLSPASGDVLRALSPLVVRGGFHVTLLFIHERAPYGQDNEAEKQRNQAELDGMRKLLPESVPVETVLREIPRGAGVDTAILEKAQELNAQAIAISTHGHSARRHLLMGSVAMSLLGRSTRPLIVARV